MNDFICMCRHFYSLSHVFISLSRPKGINKLCLSRMFCFSFFGSDVTIMEVIVGILLPDALISVYAVTGHQSDKQSQPYQFPS